MACGVYTHPTPASDFFTMKAIVTHAMGFGSYDESEQENQEYDTDFDDDDGLDTEEDAHQGNVEFEFTASNDELLDRLKDIKEDEPTNT